MSGVRFAVDVMDYGKYVGVMITDGRRKHAARFETGMQYQPSEKIIRANGKQIMAAKKMLRKYAETTWKT